MEYGANKEGYWTSDKFLQQMEKAVKIADLKYPKSEGYKITWIFDNSSCHNAYSQDALVAMHMNAKCGGKQPCMRDTMWKGKVQKLVNNKGIPKGLIQVLKERGKYREKMKLAEMREEIATHQDFQDEKTRLQHFLHQHGHTCILLPKFHCELNPIERCWGQAKRYTRAHTNYTLPRLRIIIPQALDSVNPQRIQKYYRKAREYMFAYLEGHCPGKELERITKIYKSHRRVGTHQ